MRKVEQPLVSICTLVYNHEPYLRACLDGFVMQRTNFAFEVLVHDDASTDGSAEIIREYTEKYPEIFKPIYQHENQYSKGVWVNATFQYPRAKGKYIALCEGDDYWTDPMKLQHQVDFMESHPDYSLCFHNAMVLNERLEVKERIQSFCHLNHSQTISTERIISEWCIPTASILFRRESFEKFELPRFFSGDYTLELALASVGKVYYIDRYMSVYRLNNGGVSSKISVEKWATQLFALLEWFDNLTSHQYHNEIELRIREVKKNTRYITLKDKSMLLPMICMPKYTLKMLRQKLSKLSLVG